MHVEILLRARSKNKVFRNPSVVGIEVVDARWVAQELDLDLRILERG